ncbi:glycosyltransferase family 2 protein [Saccharibacillus deserti]|uniref:glycosyltransferase family 2 protein n=1 Tax=Saccharibacillus deserti TaxID=1634444 RepID=UPI001C1314ED|nr:glycosyltransferase family 2 protein [Saccharibacillus deserti]
MNIIEGQQSIVSVVIPIYNNAASLFELNDRLHSTLKKITPYYEIIFINDCSKDHSWETIADLANKHEEVIGVNFSRNFGQHYAISAGLDLSQGEWVVVMDGDLQDQPEEIEKLYKKALEGYDIVQGRRAVRKDRFLKKLSSKLFHHLYSYLTDTVQDEAIANFGIYHRKVIDVMVSMRESLRVFSMMVRWTGFNATSIDIEHAKRKEGESGYSFKKLIRLSINAIISFSDKPLRLTVKAGFLISILAFLYAVYIIIKALLGITSIQGWPSLIASIWLTSGFIIFIVGVTGLYISRIFDETKKRPIYVIKEVYRKNIAAGQNERP